MFAKAFASSLEGSSADDFSSAFVLGEEIEAGSFSTVFKATAATDLDAPQLSEWSKQQRFYAVKRVTRSGLCEDDERKVLEEVRRPFLFLVL